MAAHAGKLLARSSACLDAMRARAQSLLALAQRDADSAAAPDQIAIERVMLERLAAVAESRAPLTFGRIDEGLHRHYIGRRHVEDEHADPVADEARSLAARWCTVGVLESANDIDRIAFVCKQRGITFGPTLDGVCSTSP